jgi:AraC-like DNA-binding protein
MTRHEWIGWRKWREISYDLLNGLEVSISDETAFRSNLSHTQNGGLKIVRLRNTPHMGQRTPQSIRRNPSDTLSLVALQHGKAAIELGGQQVQVSPGDMYVHDLERPMRSSGVGKDMVEWVVIHVQRSALEDALPVVNTATSHKLDGSLPANRVLRSFMQALSDNADQMAKGTTGAFELATTDLLRNALLLNRDSDQAQYAQALNRVQATILLRLREPNLDIQKIAQEVGIGPRTIYRMFQSIGTTPAKWVEEKRLTRIGKELRSPSNAGKSISQIALSFGYNELAHFSRSFKRQFGVSPRAYRKD